MVVPLLVLLLAAQQLPPAWVVAARLCRYSSQLLPCVLDLQVVVFDRSPEKRAPFYNLLRALGMARMVGEQYLAGK
jgi:hypothetical protein